MSSIPKSLNLSIPKTSNLSIPQFLVSKIELTIDQPNPTTSLLERILSRENMLMAWQQVKVNQGSYGVDKMTITALPEYARAHWATNL